MPLPATEVIILRLKADATIEDGESTPSKTWKSTIATILAQEGAQSHHWGRQVEHPDLIEILVDWETIEHHKKFSASPAHGPFLNEIRSLVDGPPTVYHVHFAPHSPASLLSVTLSGVLEHLIFYFEPGLGEAERAKWEKVYTNFLHVIASYAEGFKGVAAGWIEEELQYEGNAATAFLAMLGWQSVEAHLAYRETKEFEESIGAIVEGCKERVVHHVKFQEGLKE